MVYSIYLYITGLLGKSTFVVKDFKRKYHLTTDQTKYFLEDFRDLGLVEVFRIRGKGVTRHYRKPTNKELFSHWIEIRQTIEKTFENKKELLRQEEIKKHQRKQNESNKENTELGKAVGND